MYEATDGSSYKRPNAMQSIQDRNNQIKNLLDNPDATSVESTPPPATPTPTPQPR